jgi:nitroreductase
VPATNPRKPEHHVEPLILDRWSPRAFTGEDIPESELMSLFEAARWAPSSYNSQPWRFLYARRGTAHWDKFLGLLNAFNQSWAKDASVLIILVSNSVMLPPGTDKAIPSHSHSLDAGAAWENLALQATKSGWHAHGMVGFDIARAFAELDVPEGYRVEQAIAVGRKADKSKLPEGLQAREMPSDRLKVSEIAFEGGFKKI